MEWSSMERYAETAFKKDTPTVQEKDTSSSVLKLTGPTPVMGCSKSLLQRMDSLQRLVYTSALGHRCSLCNWLVAHRFCAKTTQLSRVLLSRVEALAKQERTA